MYFSQPQRSEFFALKGTFLAKLGMNEDAVAAFSSANQIDLNLPTGWAAWGTYNDTLFNDTESAGTNHAADAVNCYMHASSLFSNAKSRKYLSRTLYLLSLPDPDGLISKAYEGFKGEVCLWYWITFIPQLLLALNGGNGGWARPILLKIAKTWPQVCFSLHRLCISS